MNADERRFLAGNSGFNLSSQFVDTTLADKSGCADDYTAAIRASALRRKIAT
jgi:hypothetical protein